MLNWRARQAKKKQHRMAASGNGLAGTWVLDKNASESIEDLLSAQGVGWAKRKVISKLQITEILEFADDMSSVTMKKETSVKNTEEKLSLDKTEQVEDDVLGSVEQHVFLENEEGKPILVISLRGASGETVNRRIVDGNKLTIHSKFTTPKGKVVECTRIFNRQK
jgi:hypothetical protein